MASREYLEYILKQTNKNVQKRRLEGEELKFFLQKSVNRLSRIRSGERLAEVVSKIEASDLNRDSNENFQNKVHAISLEMMDKILKKQFEKKKNIEIEPHLLTPFNYNGISDPSDVDEISESELVESFKTMENLYNYLTGNIFDPRQEFYKEKDIENFFKLKYKLISDYLGR
jgi:hypothetical protein